MSELNCSDCMVLGQQLELAEQEIRRLRADIAHLEREAREAVRDAAAEATWAERDRNEGW